MTWAYEYCMYLVCICMCVTVYVCICMYFDLYVGMRSMMHSSKAACYPSGLPRLPSGLPRLRKPPVLHQLLGHDLASGLQGGCSLRNEQKTIFCQNKVSLCALVDGVFTAVQFLGSFAVVLIVILSFTIQIQAYTCKYMQNTDYKKVSYHWSRIYMHILPNTCKYMQIHAIQPDLFRHICTYLQVFGVSICKYLCQYLQVLQVFASNL